MVMYVTHRVHIMDNNTLNVYGNNYLRGIKKKIILKPVYVNVSLQCNLHATQEGRDELELKSTLTSLSLSHYSACGIIVIWEENRPNLSWGKLCYQICSVSPRHSEY